MTDQDARQINTQGGQYFQGDIQAQGDVVGGNKVVQYYQQIDLQKLVEVLKQNLPEDDQSPDQLVEVIQSFQRFHQQLHEWKELHNLLNDILFTQAQFTREVERVDATQEPPNLRTIERLWRPIAQKIILLLDWSTTVRTITNIPFQQTPQGLQGPAWAVELQVAKTRLDALVEGKQVDLNELYDAAFDFLDVAERHMYLADKQLRETATELYNLSRIVLGRLDHDDK